jgi:hypothetical protein
MLHLRKAFYSMGKILITGNGFDLFHHLPTKYNHFISIMQTIESNVYATEVSFEELFGDVFKDKFPNDFNLIVENYNSANIEFSCEKLNRIKELLEKNLWYKHFKNILEIDTWIDFEIEIETILDQLAIFDNHKNKKAIEKNSFIDPLIEYSAFESFDIIKIYGGQGDFKIIEKYINKRNVTIDIKGILEDLAKSFEDFIIIFNRYLVDIVCVFYTEIIQKSVIPFHLMNEIYTFNYTPTLENVYKVDKSKVIYLHGEINEDCSGQNLVFGVSEISQDVKKTKAYDFAKYYQRIKKNSNRKFIEIPDKKSGLDETIFYIIGHSLDESDKVYILDLFKFLEFDLSANSKICIFYHSTHDREHKLKNLFNIIDKNVVVEMNKAGRLYFVKLDIENIHREFSRETFIAGDSVFFF